MGDNQGQGLGYVGGGDGLDLVSQGHHLLGIGGLEGKEHALKVSGRGGYDGHGSILQDERGHLGCRFNWGTLHQRSSLVLRCAREGHDQGWGHGHGSVTNGGRMGARDFPNGVMSRLTFVGFHRGVQGRANTLVHGRLSIGLAFGGLNPEVVGEGSELRAQLLFNGRLAAFQLLQVSLMGGSCGMLKGFGIHGFEVVVIEGVAMSDSLSLRSLVGLMVEIMAVADKASFEIVHVFHCPGDDIMVFSLVKEDGASMFTEVVGLDKEPIHNAGVSAINVKDAVIVGYEEANKHLLHGFKLACNPAVGLFREGRNGGGGNRMLGSANILITGLQD